MIDWSQGLLYCATSMHLNRVVQTNALATLKHESLENHYWNESVAAVNIIQTIDVFE